MHRPFQVRSAIVCAAVGLAFAACGGGATPPPAGAPGTPDHPRVVIMAAKDYTYIPASIDLYPGETVTLEVVNGGLITHEVVLGGVGVQAAWEAAEAVTAELPPGRTPDVSVPPEVGGLHFVLRSGERVDATWRVPPDAASDAGGWFVGCHIPEHWAAGMVVPIRFLGADGLPLPTVPARPVP